MQYMLLIYSPESDDQTPPDPAEMQRWFDYDQALHDEGVHVAGAPLHGTSAATTVRNRDGDTVTTDGPFAETKEVLGGYYIVDVADLDAALEWAARCPGADHGSIEVRPVMSMDELAPS